VIVSLGWNKGKVTLRAMKLISATCQTQRSLTAEREIDVPLTFFAFQVLILKTAICNRKTDCILNFQHLRIFIAKPWVEASRLEP